MKNCLIISGGEFNSLPSDFEYDYCIACDHGFDHAKKLGIKPDLLIGDFDSLESIKDDFKDVPVQSFDTRKDDTDTMLAIKHALSLGYKHIVLTCALGK
ncbi:MAG: thiamine diphosphokinase, partial [Lachnospiraceae bacterium]|nr:thiamine diphosphokinase [Lachnospiraceae bacterium]